MDKLTSWQRGIMLGVSCVANMADDPTRVWFTRRALECLMWFDWHGYHTGKINKLVEWGWLVSGHTEDGIIAYAATDVGLQQLRNDTWLAAGHIRYIPKGQPKLF